MDGLVSSALMIRLSLQPSPACETSAFNKIRVFSNRWAGLFPFPIRASSCSRSSAFNRTTYFFTEISFAAMIASVVITVDETNHQNLSNWLKLATRLFSRGPPSVQMAHGLAPHDSQEGRQGSSLLAPGAQRSGWTAGDPA